MVSIQHDIPKHNCIAVLQPARGGYAKRCHLVNGTGEAYELVQKDNTKVNCTLLDYWEYDVTAIPESLSYLVYGMQVTKLIKSALRRFPELKTNPKVEILLLYINAKN